MNLYHCPHFFRIQVKISIIHMQVKSWIIVLCRSKGLVVFTTSNSPFVHMQYVDRAKLLWNTLLKTSNIYIVKCCQIIQTTYKQFNIKFRGNYMPDLQASQSEFPEDSLRALFYNQRKFTEVVIVHDQREVVLCFNEKNINLNLCSHLKFDICKI